MNGHNRIYLDRKIKGVAGAISSQFNLLNSEYLGKIQHDFKVNLEFSYNWDYPPSEVLKRWETEQEYSGPPKC